MTASSSALLLFCGSFLTVFALGWQSLHVNGGHYMAAFLNSFIIGSLNMLVLKLAPGAGPVEVVAFILGGPFGIVAAMWSHRHFFRQSKSATIP